jgi:ABC-type branched-subunit amino acid transport system substrate-binding protein
MAEEVRMRRLHVAVVGTVLVAAAALGAAPGCSKDAGTTASADKLTIALISPKSGALREVGLSFERVAHLAVNEVNAQGGVNGRELELLVVDDESMTVFAHPLYEAMADIGVLAVIGPARSGSVANIIDAASERRVPTISPSSTDPELSPRNDGGYIFRNVSDDDFQGLAMAHYLADLAEPRVLDVVVVAERSAYGDHLSKAFTAAFTRAGRDGHVASTIEFDANLTPENVAATVDQIVAAAPAMVVMVALEQDALKIVNAWDASGQLPGLKWFFTDGARSMGFLLGAPASIIGSLGTAPTNPDTGDAYGVLVDRYDSVSSDHVTDQVYAANVWDAVFLISAAMVQQGSAFPDEPIGGEHLRDAITSVSKTGQIYNAGQWADLVAAIVSGADVDYDGASGPCDFEEGEAIGPYEVWQLTEDGAAHRSFERKVFLEAQGLE